MLKGVSMNIDDIKELRRLAPIITTRFSDNELNKLYRKWSTDFFAAGWMSPDRQSIKCAINYYNKSLIKDNQVTNTHCHLDDSYYKIRSRKIPITVWTEYGNKITLPKIGDNWTNMSFEKDGNSHYLVYTIDKGNY